MDLMLRAIAEPRRRAILRLIQDQERTSGEIASYFTVTKPAISQHLSVLADAGLVTVRREGTRRLYRARPESLNELRYFLDTFWSDRLLDLKDAAEAAEEEFNRDDG